MTALGEKATRSEIVVRMAAPCPDNPPMLKSLPALTILVGER
jgi:hypothetical protein